MKKKTIIGLISVLLITAFLIPIIKADDGDDEEVGIFYENFNGETGSWKLDEADDEATTFGLTLEDDGWSIDENQGNSACIADDWDSTSDNDNTDDVDIAWITSHGGFTQGVACWICTGNVYSSSYAFSSADCSWGDNDMEWAILQACIVLDSDEYDNWDGAFDGVHGICGIIYNGIPTHGGTRFSSKFADYLVLGWDMQDSWELANVWFYDEIGQTATCAIYREQVRVNDSYNIDYADDELGAMAADKNG